MPKKRTDKERLDFLEIPGGGSWEFTPQVNGSIYFWEMGGKEYPRGLYFKNIRQAIDAAMSCEAKNKSNGEEAGHGEGR